MAAITAPAAERLDRDAATLPIGEVAAYLQAQLGQRMTAFLAGLSDAKQIGRYATPGGPAPRSAVANRLRHGYKVVRMISDAYDASTAKAWLFGTNTRLDDEAPIEVLRTAADPEQFTAVVRAARQLASFEH
ncbi:MAG TPA: hypothetical protein VLK58_02600 [Conexibacter sp.]|nr:hypothetical protein [Conexibacter sp.]